MENPEEILKKLPKFKADNVFSDTLKEKISNNLLNSRPSFTFPYKLVLSLVSILIIAGGIFYYTQIKKQNLLKPSAVLAQEIIKRNLLNFFQKGTIYHETTKLYPEGKTEPVVYDLWEDMDTQRFLNHVIYPLSVKPEGEKLWQGFDLDSRWEINITKKEYTKEIYLYNHPEEREEKLGERADLPRKYDELLKNGILETKEGKLDEREVYVIYDTRNNPDKSWDVLTFDKNTFQLLQTENYSGKGAERHLTELMTYYQESLPRDEASINKLFNTLPVSTKGYQTKERHFDTSKGYIDDYYTITESTESNKPPPSVIPSVSYLKPLVTETPAIATITVPVPTSTPFPTNTPTPPPRTPNPPIINISYPTEMQSIEFTSPGQNFCIVDSPAGGNTEGVQRKHNLNDAGWTTYSDIFTLCFSPIEGLNRFQVQYRNKYGDESSTYTRQFNFHKAY